jgi:hypothetical protein
MKINIIFNNKTSNIQLNSKQKPKTQPSFQGIIKTAQLNALSS